MFTVEMEWDESAITILDETCTYEDFQINIFDDVVYLRQWSDEIDRYQVIVITPKMLEEFRTAFKLPTGAYRLEGKQ